MHTRSKDKWLIDATSGFKKNVNRATTQVMMKTGMLRLEYLNVYMIWKRERERERQRLD